MSDSHFDPSYIWASVGDASWGIEQPEDPAPAEPASPPSEFKTADEIMQITRGMC